MRKFGLLAALTIVGMLSFSASVLAADGTPTDPASQGSANNGTGYNTENLTTKALDGSDVTFSGQSYRMDTFGNAGTIKDNNPQTGGTNGTGFTSPVPTDADIKYDSDGNQKIHSAYTKTSDACASCHTVHNSVNSGALLQWEDPQTACWACHDGTVDATYNVVTGMHNDKSNTANQQVNSAGLFGIGNELGLSNHGMSPKEPAFVTTSAAPGGAEVATGAQAVNKIGDKAPTVDADGNPVYTDNIDKNGNWNTEFSCVACHDPHGTFGNARILNPNVNDIAFTNQVKGETLTKIDDTHYQTINTSVYSSHELAFTLYDSGLVGKLDPSKTDGTLIAAPGKVNSQLYTLNPMTGIVTFSYTPTGTVKADYFHGLEVKMDVQGKLTANETVKYQKGINEFCGACHTDYNNVNKVPVWKTTDGKDTSVRDNNGISTGIQATDPVTGALIFTTGGAYKQALGDYRKAYRHSVGFTRTASLADLAFTDANSLDALYPGLKFDTSNPKSPNTIAPTVDCLTCHYAHGTSDQFIQDSLTDLGQIGSFDVNQLVTYDDTRTTALKRLPNMGVCQACHNKQ